MQDQIQPWQPTLCNCYTFSDRGEEIDPAREPLFHTETQDPKSPAACALDDLIQRAATERWTDFEPAKHLSGDYWRQIHALPPTIAKITSLKRIRLYNAPLNRLPPEIGQLADLEELNTYTSYQLHWYPYELTRCKKLKQSAASTRALYGNYKSRSPFPKLPTTANSILVNPTSRLVNCSVCSKSFPTSQLQQFWISLQIAKYVLPLLVNACSQGCIQTLPKPLRAYLPPHQGGLGLQQPPPRSLENSHLFRPTFAEKLQRILKPFQSQTNR